MSLCLLVVLGLSTSGVRAQDPTKPIASIAIVMDGPWRTGPDPRPVFEREIRELLGSVFDVRFEPENSIYGDWTIEGVAKAVDTVLGHGDVDILLAAGFIASFHVSKLAADDRLPIPVIAPVILDAHLYGLDPQNRTSGLRNFSYLTLRNTFVRDLLKFQEIVRFDSVAVLVHESALMTHPQDRMDVTEAHAGVSIEVVGVGESADEVLRQLNSGTQAVYLFPLPHLSQSEFARLAGGLIERKIPSFSFFGGEYVERGLMVSLNPGIIDRLARRVALNTFDILQGADPAELPVSFFVGEQLQLNTRTARAIGVYPSWDILVEAETIFDLEAKGPVERVINLEYAVQEGVMANLSVLAQDRVVARGAWEVRRARAGLLPQVDVSATGLQVDKNLAETSFGAQPERSLTLNTTLTQILYSEQAHANYAVEQRLQEARQFDRETLVLDVALDVAIAYLNVLRAKALEQIEFENVKLTRSNLQLARVREDLGQSGPAEVLRWETQIATNRKDQILASAKRRAAEVALNQILNRPLEEPFETAETRYASPDQLLEAFPYLPYVNNPHLFTIFRNFMVGEALVGAPELKAFDRAIAAQERIHTATRRAYWLPDIGLRAGTSTDVATGGAGSDGPALDLPFEFPESNDTHWNLGVTLTYPLFQGLQRRADRAVASERLAQLRTERELTRTLVEQRLRTAAELAGGSHGAIEQSRRAAEAAQKTLELVTDAYARGAVSILELLDAQNSALITRTVEATAVYDFLADLMQAQRAVGRFDFLSTNDERAAFKKRMDDHFRAAGVEIGPN